MSKTAVFTIISRNYLAYARTLMQSVRKHSPEYDRFVCLVDDPLDPAMNFDDEFEIVMADEIGIPEFEATAFRYDVMEFNTAAKPFMFNRMLADKGYDRAIYLDPDTCVYRPLVAVDNALEGGASAVLTPHVRRPLEDGFLPNDHDFLKSGTFNLGFAAFTAQQESLEFVRWWGRRLSFQCYADLSAHQFTDQRWCDLAPSFIDRLAILRNPGYNAAYWNLAERPVTSNDNCDFEFDGEPLAFFHFSGLSFNDARLVSRHQNRLDWVKLGPLQALFSEHRERLMENCWADTRLIPYGYGVKDGVDIKPIMRRLYRRLYPEANPQEQIDRDFIIGMCNSEAMRGRADDDLRFTRLMQLVHEERTDLTEKFNFAREGDLRKFVTWFEKSAARDYDLTDEFSSQAHFRSANQETGWTAPPRPHPNANRSAGYRLWRKVRKSGLLALGRNP